MLSRTALGGIWIYQQFISPRKGFRCAHAVLHGDTGCSGFAKQAIREKGFWPAVPLIRARFRACKAAYLVLRDGRDHPEDSNKKKSDSCAKQARDEFCGTVVIEGCCSATSGIGRTVPRSPSNCDVGCDICSCG